MIQDPVTLVFVSLVLIIAVSIALYLLLRTLKGRVIIKLPQTVYEAGSMINGVVELTAKKRLDVNRIIASCICEEYFKAGRRSSSRSQTIRLFDKKHELSLLQTSLLGDYSWKFTFELPASLSKPTLANDSLVGQIGNIALSQMQGEKQWYILVQCDCKGIDLVAKTRFHVN